MTSTTPQAALRLVAERDDLVLHENDMGDMIEPLVYGAVLSSGEPAEWRYMLWRIWNAAAGLLVVVMLNPSTADHLADDRTISGLMRRARRLGYGGILVVNCFAFRATEPKDMMAAADPIGPANDAAITYAIAEKAGMLLCAWGTDAGHMQREDAVKCMISSADAKPHALRLCANGAPGHPLYIALETMPFEWHGISPSSSAATTPK